MACLLIFSKTNLFLPILRTISLLSLTGRGWWPIMREFDLGFLNAELERAECSVIPRDQLIDTLLLARRKYPGGSNRLDDLCVRFGIDNSHRTKHGALLDAELLAEIYLELIGGRQAQLALVVTTKSSDVGRGYSHIARTRPIPIPTRLTEADIAAHKAFVAELGQKAVWNEYTGTD